MKKLILILTLIITTLCLANPEYYSSKRILSGEIQFQSKENKYISLEKEFLEISFNKGLQYDISYMFKNNSDKKQIVKTAFPVKAQFILGLKQIPNKPYYCFYEKDDVTHDKDVSLFFEKIMKISKHNFSKLPPNIGKIMAKTGYDRERGAQIYCSENFKKMSDIHFNQQYSYEEFQKLFIAENEFTQKNENLFNNYIRGFKVVQNSKKVPIKTVVLTFEIKKKSMKFYDDINKKTVKKINHYGIFTVHFLHTLILEPKQSIKVSVNYSINSTYKGDARENIIANHYILGTGRTWRGNIKELLIKTPYYLTPDLPKIFKKVQKEDKKYNYYLALNYEPKKEDEIYTSFSYINFQNEKSIQNYSGDKKTFDLTKSESENNNKSKTLALENEKKLEQESSQNKTTDMQAKKADSIKKSKTAASVNNEMSPYILLGSFLLIGVLIIFLLLLKKRDSKY